MKSKNKVIGIILVAVIGITILFFTNVENLFHYKFAVHSFCLFVNPSLNVYSVICVGL